MVNDLGSDGGVHMSEKHLPVAVQGHTAVHHHERALHCLPPPRVVLLQGQQEEDMLGGGDVLHLPCWVGAGAAPAARGSSLVTRPKEPLSQPTVPKTLVHSILFN